jgi:hypothetical protein
MAWVCRTNLLRGDAHKAEREAYQAHIEATLKLAGSDEAAA